MQIKKMIFLIALIAMAIIPVCAQQNEPESNFRTRTIDGGRGLEITGYMGDSWEVHIPDVLNDLPVTSIGIGAFREHTAITHVIIPNGVTSIGIGAFWGCYDLIDVIIPDSVTTIGDEAFTGCSNLTIINIPDSVTSIGRNAFNDCISLIKVIFQGTIPSSGFNNESLFPSFPGDLRAKFYASDRSSGTPGTYTRPNGTNTTWTFHHEQ